MERKKFQCPLCGAPLDMPLENPGCGGFREWHEEGFACINVNVAVSEEEEQDANQDCVE